MVRVKSVLTLNITDCNDCLGQLPPNLFYQIDGGSENIAKSVLYMCEFLIAKRVFRKIVLSRLMVGHTHCDIDAVFGRLWLPLRVSDLFT